MRRRSALSIGAGTFAGGDVWPGDVLDVTSGGADLNVIVRKVTVEDAHAAPEVLRYKDRVCERLGRGA